LLQKIISLVFGDKYFVQLHSFSGTNFPLRKKQQIINSSDVNYKNLSSVQ